MFKCNQGCQRTFNQESIQKHQEICKKVFLQKRKEFDAFKQRAIIDEKSNKNVSKKVVAVKT